MPTECNCENDTAQGEYAKLKFLLLLIQELEWIKRDHGVAEAAP